MINLTVLLPTKNKKNERKGRYGTMFLLIFAFFISSCSTPRVILGEIQVYGNNEIKIDAPTRK
jgi:hypothetical protein